mmetsp:Transcript_25938/g.56321  ORF Transcript_25938/g.56321 Transcript_25938/m.56321 type:complete len:295 (-) Transcript_25938:203-1087(-)
MAMICLLSPAKAMNLDGGNGYGVLSKPSLAKETQELLPYCKQLTAKDMKSLMGVSDAIAAKDVERYRNWDQASTKAACLAMDGPAFQAFAGTSLSPPERTVAQAKVRILSGLYGVLKPFDEIKPYRLEMGCGLKTGRGKSLYDFWGDIIANEISKGASVIINAASQEYFKSVKVQALGNIKVITMDFPGPSVFAKRARGLICRFAVQHDCKKPEDLKKFAGTADEPYAFDAAASSDTKYVFRKLGNGTAAKAKGKAKAKAKAKAKGKSKAKAKATHTATADVGSTPRKRPAAAR